MITKVKKINKSKKRKDKKKIEKIFLQNEISYLEAIGCTF